MGILGIIFLILVLIMFGMFIYFMVKTAHGWGALHTTMLFFLFFSTLVFLFSAAGIAKRRVAWVKAHDKLKKNLEELANDEIKIKYGDLSSTAQDDNALIPAIALLTRLTSDRGRVWKSATLQNIDPKAEEYTLRLSLNRAGQPGAELGAPAAAAPAAAPGGKVLDEQLVVYAFGEGKDASGRQVPNAYLGEFVVDKSVGLDAKLKPTAPLLPMQRDYIAQGNASQWTLFELMPVDSHEIFTAEGSQKSETEYFGHIDEQLVTQLLGAAAANNPAVQAVINSYLKDGLEAPGDIAPENLWILVEFVKEHEIEVDSKEKRNATEGGFFNPVDGRTVDERLKQGGELAKVKYLPGDKGLFWKGAAEELIELGAAKAIKKVYVRTLNNYSNGFRDLRQDMLSCIQQIELLKRENDIVQKTNLSGQEQLTIQQEKRQKLDKELPQAMKEQTVAASEVQRLESEIAILQKKISGAFQSLQGAHSQILSNSGMIAPNAAP